MLKFGELRTKLLKYEGNRFWSVELVMESGDESVIHEIQEAYLLFH